MNVGVWRHTESGRLFFIYFLALLINIIIIYTRRRVTSSVLGTDHTGIDIFLPKFCVAPTRGDGAPRSSIGGADSLNRHRTPVSRTTAIAVTFEASRLSQNRFKLYLSYRCVMSSQD